MASFSQTIQGKHGVKTYQETKNTYDWIIKAIRHIYTEHIHVDLNFLFDIGEITCSCTTIEEFIENAYGCSEYFLNHINFYVFKNHIRVAFIMINHRNEISVSSGTKIELERIVRSLNEIDLNEDEINDPISVMYIEDNSNIIVVDGDKNVIATDSSVATNVDLPANTEPKWEQTLNSIWQNIVANWLWYILCLAAGVFLSWAISKGYIPAGD